ncbi:MAG: glycosyltransferase family 2 protein [Treponema sp.]|nr:glycosyltransferase family 2 protein [Treponema sp.]
MDVSIIIVNYNTKQLLADCLNSIYEQTNGIEFEVIVSDNGSTDGSIEMLKNDFPQVAFIENNANLGFGAANNRGLKIAKGKYIFYLNSDTILLNNAVKIFFDYFEENGEKEKLGALGCMLVKKDGAAAISSDSFLGLEENFCYFLKDKFYLLFSTYYKAFKHYLFRYKLKEVKKSPVVHQKGFVDFIIGADLFLRNDEFAKFDEHYFMYCEEVDLQYQMEKNNLTRKIIETPKIIHLEGGSSSRKIYEVLDLASFTKIQTAISKIYFLKKNALFSPLRIFILRLTMSVVWLNPLIFKQTARHIAKLWKI